MPIHVFSQGTDFFFHMVIPISVLVLLHGPVLAGQNGDVFGAETHSVDK